MQLECESKEDRGGSFHTIADKTDDDGDDGNSDEEGYGLSGFDSSNRAVAAAAA